MWTHVDSRVLTAALAGEMAQMDPDIITGYNITNFDIPYLLNRATALKMGRFAMLGRIRNESATIKKSTFSSKAYGTRENKITSTLVCSLVWCGLV